MKIVHKIALNTVGIVLLVTSVTFVGIGLIWFNVNEIVERENPKVQAALEMEINAKEAAKDIMDYISNGKKEEKEEFKDNIADFQRFHNQYVNHMRTVEEENLLLQIDTSFAEFKVIAEELFELKDKQDKLIDDRGVILNNKVDVILDDKLGRLAHGNGEKDIAVREMEINVHELISATRGYLITGKPFLKNRITDSEQDYNKAEKTYAGLELNAEEQNGFNELKGYWKTILAQTSEIIRLEDRKRELSKALEENGHNLDYILDEKIQTVAMSKIKADETRTLTIISTVLGTTIAICFLAVIVSAYISKRISMPIQELGIAAAKIGKGDLDTRIKVTKEDELGLLAHTFNEMAQSRKKAEDELEYLAKFPSENPNPVLRIAADGKLLYTNPASESLVAEWGCQVGQIVPGHWQNIIADAFQEGTEQRTEIEHGGKIFSFVVTPVIDAGYANLYGRDITKRKKLEETQKQQFAQLAHMSRLTTVGEMTSSLAHELNQPLCAAMNYANVCLHTVGADNANTDKLIENVEAVAKQTKRAGEIVKRIKDFVKKHEPQETTVDINTLVKRISDFIRIDVRKNKISLNLVLAEELPPLLADPVQIEQALLNLAINSIEAMAGVELEQRRLTIQTKMSTDHFIEVAVIDTGEGISAENSEKIFDSFFTTKPAGLGIGLSISRSIIDAHKGRLWAEANPDCGVTFRFTLPVAGSI